MKTAIAAPESFDTTSAIYGQGKRTSIKQYTGNALFRTQAQVFTKSDSTKEEVTTAGETELVSLCNGKPGMSLDQLRLQRFHQKVVVSKSTVKQVFLTPIYFLSFSHGYRREIQACEKIHHILLNILQFVPSLYDEY